MLAKKKKKKKHSPGRHRSPVGEHAAASTKRPPDVPSEVLIWALLAGLLAKSALLWQASM